MFFAGMDNFKRQIKFLFSHISKKDSLLTKGEVIRKKPEKLFPTDSKSVIFLTI